MELTFGQDLNGDGIIGIYAAPGTTLVINQLLSGPAGVATIGAGATLELQAADSSTVTFAAGTGKLIIDHSSTFTGQIKGFTGDGVVATSDIIDLEDVANLTATRSFSGTATIGSLTVTDAANDIAHISLAGIYSSFTASNFFLSSDGGTGTYVIDPPPSQTPTSVLNATSIPAHLMSNAPLHDANAVVVAQQSNNNADVPAPLAFIGSGVVAPASKEQAVAARLAEVSTGAAGAQAASSTGVAREIVSPQDVIRAIKTSEISIKRADGDARGAELKSRVWLFDELEDAFVPPAPEAFTITVEHDRAKPATSDAAEYVMGLAASAMIVSAEPSWRGALRQFGRKAAQIVKWTQ